jgi:hypothetical protein
MADAKIDSMNSRTPVRQCFNQSRSHLKIQQGNAEMIVGIVRATIGSFLDIFHRFYALRRQNDQDALVALERDLPFLEETAEAIYKLLFPKDHIEITSKPNVGGFPFTKKLSSFSLDNGVLAGGLSRLQNKRQKAQVFLKMREYVRTWEKCENRFGSWNEPDLPAAIMIFRKVAIRFRSFSNETATP